MPTHDNHHPGDEWAAERLEKLVRALLKGRRPRILPTDAADHGAILVAVLMAAARDSYPRMRPAFRRRMSRALAASR